MVTVEFAWGHVLWYVFGILTIVVFFTLRYSVFDSGCNCTKGQISLLMFIHCLFISMVYLMRSVCWVILEYVRVSS